jgi:hypothetical protein
MAKKISNQLESLASLTSSTNRIGTLGVTVAMRTTKGQLFQVYLYHSEIK